MVWRYREPKKAGYYLVAWRRSPTQVVVSELWFNPDAMHHWWFTRGYARQRSSNPLDDALKNEVVAWMPMPDPPKDLG